MAADGYALFQTSIGACGIAWTVRGVCAVLLPEAHEAATRERLRRRFPDAGEAPPPERVRRAMTAIAALLEGQGADVTDVPLDLTDVPAFDRRVYEVARTVPPGSTETYGGVAARLGEPGAAQAVGRALGRNPLPLIVPCHRIVAAGGASGGFSAPGGKASKLRLLQIEGARLGVRDDRTLEFDFG